MKIISFNVNGIRAIVGKSFVQDMEEVAADIICLQETKASPEQVKEAISKLTNYHVYANSAERKGYSGTAIISKTKPLSVSRDIGISEHDAEGRVLCLEYEKFFLINVYVPNSGSELKRLSYRQEWDLDFFNYLKIIKNFSYCKFFIDIAC